MSLILDMGTQPAGLAIKTFGIGGSMGKTVYLGDYQISLEDFLGAAKYVLTNTDLEPNDPRLQFVKCVQAIEQTDGYNPGRKRLESSEPAVLPAQS
ncbi:MAG: hypothetical protein Q8P45_03180 [Candidatus Harrisonbacteria bacterium]|nr:hypothetical protein [Candidatus Harrisonbacteria bacterium]